RREILIFGKGVGDTRLTLWDQRGVRRTDITITVTTRQDVDTLATLGEMLRDFPTVTVRQISGSALIVGTVSSKDDQAAIEKIAAATKAKNLVRYAPPPNAGAVTVPSRTPLSLPGSTLTGSTNNRGNLNATPELEYEIELLEASSKFRSGSYAKGVEPSGR